MEHQEAGDLCQYTPDHHQHTGENHQQTTGLQQQTTESHQVYGEHYQNGNDNCQQTAEDHQQSGTSTKTKVHRCHTCQLAYSTASELQKHMKIHDPNKPYQCQHCSKNFHTKTGLDIHAKKHTGKRPYKCDECDKAFITKPVLVMHMRGHTGEKPYECKVCHARYTQSSTLADHMRRHTGEKQYQCPVCYKRFITRINYRHHVCVCLGTSRFECKFCNKKCPSTSSLNHHIKTHTGDRPFECAECGKCFINKSALSVHIKIHTNEKPFKCDVCNECFAFKRSLNLHKEIHLDGKPFQCEKCGMVLSSMSCLRRHEVGQFSCMKNLSFKQWLCKICGRQFHTRLMARRHREECDLRTVHVSFCCDFCRQEYKTCSALAKHLLEHAKPGGLGYEDLLSEMSTYSNEEYNPALLVQRYNKSVKHTDSDTSVINHIDSNASNQNFALKSSLTKPDKTLVENKIFQCDKCGRKYSTLYRLQHHEEKLKLNASKTKRTFENFLCRTCGRQYASKGNATRHMQDCSDDNVHAFFFCDFCNQDYGTYEGLVKHLLEHAKPGGHGYEDLLSKMTEDDDENPALIVQKYNISRNNVNSDTSHQQTGNTASRNAQHMYNSRTTGHDKTHANNKIIQCEKCKKIFKNVNNFQYHKARPFACMNFFALKLYLCRICGRQYSALKTARQHRRTCNSKTVRVRFFCDFCRHESGSYETFIEHLLMHVEPGGYGYKDLLGNLSNCSNNDCNPALLVHEYNVFNYTYKTKNPPANRVPIVDNSSPTGTTSPPASLAPSVDNYSSTVATSPSANLAPSVDNSSSTGITSPPASLAPSVNSYRVTGTIRPPANLAASVDCYRIRVRNQGPNLDNYISAENKFPNSNVGYLEAYVDSNGSTEHIDQIQSQIQLPDLAGQHQGPSCYNTLQATHSESTQHHNSRDSCTLTKYYQNTTVADGVQVSHIGAGCQIVQEREMMVEEHSLARGSISLMCEGKRDNCLRDKSNSDRTNMNCKHGTHNGRTDFENKDIYGNSLNNMNMNIKKDIFKDDKYFGSIPNKFVTLELPDWNNFDTKVITGAPVMQRNYAIIEENEEVCVKEEGWGKVDKCVQEFSELMPEVRVLESTSLFTINGITLIKNEVPRSAHP